MAEQSDALAVIQAKLQQAMQRNKSREYTFKFDFEGVVRACCLSKPFTYSDILKSIQSLFGTHILASLDVIRCLFSRNDALRLPISNDEDLKKALAIAKSNGSTKLNFLLMKKTQRRASGIPGGGNANDAECSSDDGQIHERSADSPPPGIIPTQRRHTKSTVPLKPTPGSNDGGFFIPESNDDTYSSSGSSVASAESSGSVHSSRRRILVSSSSRRAMSVSSDTNGGSTTNSTDSSSQISSASAESLGSQITSASHIIISPQTPINWKLGRQLGQGAFGKVYLCYDVDNGSELAIKQIPIQGLNRETSREVKILECEINIYKQLDHERIVRYLGAIRTEECLQIFMEYMAGGSVREQILNYGALTEQLTKKYTKQILQGLAYLHEKLFVHRDIKCANILRDVSGNIKLGDFGTSKQLIAITNQNQPDSGTIGTAHWTAPEIIQGSVFGRKADIWSLGCTIVEMLTTGPPWQHLQPIAAIFHIATHDKPEYKLPENASPLAREFIDACLTKDYHQRPGASELILHPFVCDFLCHTHAAVTNSN